VRGRAARNYENVACVFNLTGVNRYCVSKRYNPLLQNSEHAQLSVSLS